MADGVTEVHSTSSWRDWYGPADRIAAHHNANPNSLQFPLDAKSNNIPLYDGWSKKALGMSTQPIDSGLTRATALGILIIFPAIFLVSCSTVSGTGGQSGRVTASKSTDPANAKDKAADRRRWMERVQRDNQLDPSGSAPGSYGSFGPRFTW
jgi:hypothetical protein